MLHCEQVSPPMNSRLTRAAVFALLLRCAAPAHATGVLFPDPAGGWLYSYEGAGTAFGSGADVADSLDGTWVRGGSSDSFTKFSVSEIKNYEQIVKQSGAPKE